MITKDKSKKKSIELKTNIHQRLIEDHLQESLTFLMLQIVSIYKKLVVCPSVCPLHFFQLGT